MFKHAYCGAIKEEKEFKANKSIVCPVCKEEAKRLKLILN